MNPQGLEAQKVGKTAEKRVETLAQEWGLPAHYEQQLDFGGHTDLVICGVRFQISATGKSAQTEKRLRRKGIYCIVAGEHISDDSIRQQIYLFINGES